MNVEEAVESLAAAGWHVKLMHVADEPDPTIVARSELVVTETSRYYRNSVTIWREAGYWITLSMDPTPIAIAFDLSEAVQAVFDVNEMRRTPPNSPDDFWFIERCLYALQVRSFYTVVESSRQISARYSSVMQVDRSGPPPNTVPHMIRARKSPPTDGRTILLTIQSGVWHVRLDDVEVELPDTQAVMDWLLPRL